ncbi:MAG: sugar phosphate isomerase/epimerase [Planctomycetes bacterium]|nr:sugar phosphate isomerase/epimerase [Planctomycetota bacterium]
MKFAYSTNAFKKYSLEETIRLIREIGFAGVEIMADRPHLYPPDYQDARKLSALKSLLKKENLAVSNLNTFTLFAIGDMHHPSWIEKEAKDRDMRIQHTKQCLHLAKELDCPNISIQPGGRLEHFTRKDAMEIFIRGLEEVIPLAKELGVKILVEPEPDLLMENSVQFGEFIRKVDTSIIGLNCDIGHFWCAGENPAEVINKLAPYIHHVHIEDISGRVHNHKICGQGEIDFPPVFTALKDIGYDGFISVELYPYQDNPVEVGSQSLQHLKQFVSEKE